jgi:hypothetical protein
MISLRRTIYFFTLLIFSGCTNTENSSKFSATVENDSLNDSLVQILEVILKKDQMYRSDTNFFKQQVQAEYDRSNQIQVDSIIKRYGWPDPKFVGKEGITAMFLVIQHSDIKTQRKYIPMVRRAVMDHKLEGKQWAYF